ncbi:MAG: molybdate ABC transporter substrate-binding protein [Rickettsiales bacterium]|nr:molybdate ABC transporter substrate-binding protein [Rickettsiales bacterium]
MVISEILVEYAKLGENSINASFSQSTDLLDQIQEGLAVDMVITSHNDWIMQLKQKGLIDITSITNLFVDRLVIVANLNQDKFNKLDVEELEYHIKHNKNFTFIIPKEEEIYTRKYVDLFLAKLNMPSWVAKYRIKTVSNISSYLMDNPNDLAILFYSQAYDDENIKIVTKLDYTLYEEIVFQAALVASENHQQAEAFLAFLKDTKSKNIFTKNGFTY